MSTDTVINGKTWSTATADQQADASGSGYILIRTDGDPLKKTQKTELQSLGVQIQEFLGGGGSSEGDDEDYQQIYLCGYPKGSSLDPIRTLGYIDYADVYSSDLVIHDAVERLRARPVARHANTTNTFDSASVGGPSRFGAVGNFIANWTGIFSTRTEQPVYSMQANSVPVASEDEAVEVDVLLHHDITSEAQQEVVDKILAVDGLKELTTDDDSGIIRLKINENVLENIAQLDEVRVIHPVNERVLMANIARGLLGFPVQDKPSTANDPMTPPYSPLSASIFTSSSSSCRYQGRDQLVCVADTGFDKGSTIDVHQDFTDRVKALHPWGRTGATDDPDGHGTHVCGYGVH